MIGDCNGYPYHYTPDSKSSNDSNIFLELAKAVHNGFEVNCGTRNAGDIISLHFFVPDLTCSTKLQGGQSCSAEHGCPFYTIGGENCEGYGGDRNKSILLTYLSWTISRKILHSSCMIIPVAKVVHL